MSARFTIAETEAFQKWARTREASGLYPKIVNYVYPQLRQNPFFGPNIKKLKGELSAYYRYRMGNYRLFYIVRSDAQLVLVAAVKARKDAY